MKFNILLLCLTLTTINAPGQNPAPLWEHLIAPEETFDQPCNSATPLACGPVLSGQSTSGAGNNFVTASYGSFVSVGNKAYDSPDKVYFFTIGSETQVNISMEILTTGMNLDMFLLSSCQPAVCIAASTGTGFFESIQKSLTPGTYYVVVDGLSIFNSTGNFDIQLSCTCSCTTTSAGQLVSCENFESYSVNDLIGPASVRWGKPSTALETPILEDASGKYLQLTSATTGLTQRRVWQYLGDRTQGRYRLSFSMMTDVGKIGDYAVYHNVPGGGNNNLNRAFRVQFNSDGTGNLYIGSVTTAAATFSFTAGKWMDVMHIIDIDQDIAELWINHEFIRSWKFSEGSLGSSTQLQALGFDAIFLFGQIPSSFRIDDICLWKRPEPCSTLPINQPVCVKNGSQVDNFSVAGCQLYTPEELIHCTSVCDFGGTLIYRSDKFSGTLEASERAPTSLYGYQEIKDAYGGNLPQPLYADIYVLYSPTEAYNLQVVVSNSSPNIKDFIFLCSSCPDTTSPPGPGQCLPSECIKGEELWYKPGQLPYKNPCSNYYYIAVTGSLGDTYSLRVFPGWNCPSSAIPDLVACDSTVSGSFPGTYSVFDKSRYEQCYNGTRQYKGTEKYYKLVLNQPNQVTFNLSASGPAGMFLYSFICGQNCLGYAENTAADPNATLTATLSEGVYYLAIDTELGNDPDFSLSLNCEQYSSFVDAQTFLSGNFQSCPTDPATMHTVAIAPNPQYVASDYFNFYFPDNNKQLKGNLEASQYWHNANQPQYFSLKSDLGGDAQKCSYAPGDSFYIFLHQTQDGRRTFKRYIPAFADNAPATFQPNGSSLITSLEEADAVNFGAETSFLRVAPNNNAVPLQFTTNEKWSVEKVNGPAGWLTVTPPSVTDGSGTVALSFAPNPSPLPRSVVLRFYATDEPNLYRQFVTIEQQGQCIIPQAVNIVPSATLVCSGTPVTFTADVGAAYRDIYNYKWSTGDTTASIIQAPPAGTASYSVTVTNKYCFVTSIDTQNIQVTPGAGFIAKVDLLAGIKCHGDATGVLRANISGGTLPFQFQWSNGTAAPQIANLPAGVYTVTVTDLAGCQDVETYQLTEPAALALADTVIQNATTNQNNGSILAQIGGGTQPYQYQWLLPNNTPITGQTLPLLDSVFAGDYKVQVVDANNCMFVSELLTVQMGVANQEPKLASQIDVFPNPSTGKVYLRFDLPRRVETEIEVFDMLGRQVLLARPGAVQADVLEFDLSDVAAGLYLVKVNLGGVVVTKKVSLKK